MRWGLRLGIAYIAVFAGAGLLQAGIITNLGDSALAGASVETFDSAAQGIYSSLSLTDVTVSTPPGFKFRLETGLFGQFVPPDPTGDQYIRNSGSLLSFVFNFDVSAFGIVIGATNQVQTLTAFDENNNFIESVAIPTQIGTLSSPFSSFHGISSNSANIRRFQVTNNSDAVLYDDLYYTSSVVPEPSSIALWSIGAGVMAFGAVRHRRREKKQLAAS